MYTYRLEIIKNGATVCQIVHTDSNYNDVREKVFRYFDGSECWYWGEIMVRRPDMIRLVDVTDGIETAANRSTA